MNDISSRHFENFKFSFLLFYTFASKFLFIMAKVTGNSFSRDRNQRLLLFRFRSESSTIYGLTAFNEKLKSGFSSNLCSIEFANNGCNHQIKTRL